MAQTIRLDSPVQRLFTQSAWDQLSIKEKNYAVYMSKASWAGAKMVFHQISYESPALFILFQAYFNERNFDILKDCAAKAGISDEEW